MTLETLRLHVAIFPGRSVKITIEGPNGHEAIDLPLGDSSSAADPEMAHQKILTHWSEEEPYTKKSRVGHARLFGLPRSISSGETYERVDGLHFILPLLRNCDQAVPSPSLCHRPCLGRCGSGDLSSRPHADPPATAGPQR